jgi:hypothetical protein
VTRDEALLGGPGLDGYAYQADTLCVACGQEHILKAPQAVLEDDLLCRDSDSLPQPIFFGEHEDARHCGECGEYLYGGEDA